MSTQLGERQPRTVQDVMRWVEEGRVAAPQAFHLMHELERPAARAVAERPAEGARRVDVILDDPDALIGLDRVKELVRELRAFVEIQHRRAAAGLAADPLVLHMIFRGRQRPDGKTRPAAG